MNTKTIAVFVLMVMVLSANAFSISDTINQEKKVLTTVATFEGYDKDDGYAFLVKADEEDEESEETIYFSEITDDALKTVNLKSETMIGKRFEITYEVTEYEVVDESGYTETYENFKITKVKSL